MEKVADCLANMMGPLSIGAEPDQTSRAPPKDFSHDFNLSITLASVALVNRKLINPQVVGATSFGDCRQRC